MVFKARMKLSSLARLDSGCFRAFAAAMVLTLTDATIMTVEMT